ncbi:MAG: hypothetical protein AB2598_03495 [Candidatus Thiodiazotropha sp.]
MRAFPDAVPGRVFTTTPWGKNRFHRINAPNQQQLTELVHTISHRIGRLQECQGLIKVDEVFDDPTTKRLGT